MTKTASPKQFSFIGNLIEDRKVQLNIEHVTMAVEALQHQRLTSVGASEMIDTLLGMAKDAPAPAAPATAADAERTARADVAVRTNGYAAKCDKCGIRIEARAGALTQEGGRWITRHFEGECPVDLQAKLNTLLADRPDGFFAVPYVGTGHTDLTFFGIRTRGNDSGDRYVVHTIGGHDDTEGVSFEWIERALNSLDTVDLDEAMQAYGREKGYCGHCGRHLTNDESRKRGLGSVCATK